MSLEKGRPSWTDSNIYFPDKTSKEHWTRIELVQMDLHRLILHAQAGEWTLAEKCI